MSIIQTIRDKGARISVILIALALVGFILTDYFSGKSRGMFNTGGNDLVGRVNGKGINFLEFNRKVDITSDNFKKQGYPATQQTTQMAQENTWENEVSRVLLEDEFERLGITVSPKELGDILYGANAPQDLKQQFTDPKTGVYNAAQAKQQIDQILKKGTAEQKASFNDYINALIQQRKTEKYLAMANSINVPRWFAEKQNADNSLMAKISFVKESYSAVSDSAVKITDKEIEDYISKHKDQFKQAESRSIDYVVFSAAPTPADTLDALNKLLALKPEFDSTKNMEQFLLSQGVEPAYNYDGFKTLKSIQSPMKDSIIKVPVGGTYGPYIDGANVMLAKLQGVRVIPDTVKLRHILIATMDRDPQTGQPYEKRDSATAFKLVDSIRTAINNGSNFDSLCVKFSDDGGSKDKGGVYESVYSGQMVGPFNDFAFTNPAGAKGIVKTQFGYHYMEIISQKGSGSGYKIAFLPKEIIASQESINNAINQANMFAADCKDRKSFDANIEKTLKPKGINKASATVAPRDGQITGLAYARQFVKDIYAADLGDVLKPERVDMNGYEVQVVAVVTEILKEGTQSVAKARAGVEAILRNEKKAELLKTKLGTISTLDAAAAAWGGKTIEVADSLRMNGKTNNAALGYEPKVLGAAFNPANKGRVIGEALAGVNGVYVVKVEDITTTPVTVDLAGTRKLLADQRKQAQNPIEGLKKAATIKDYRAEKY